ncbi:MAG TPA: Kiwa anti-phage protein KwaB-like domain-containing protein [Caulobacteraceae bacterium]|jgi:hypothetical protein|nr:Kiwa anti-phage protein KwaB-like domain-containing protein [Caulobacteraceae bacterium]
MSLDALHNFPVANSTVSVWAFKKSQRERGGPPTYVGRWVQTTNALDAALRTAIDDARAAITETLTYGLLAQNNEASALSLPIEQTHARLVIDQAADPRPDKRVGKLKDIANAGFYVVKLVNGDRVIHGVRKTDDSWYTRKSHGAMSVTFSDNRLDLDTRERFTISKYFDFFIVDQEVLVLSKGRFESLLSYKQAHIDDFTALQQEAAFLAIFSELAPLLAYVGTNKMQLRRATAIRERQHYKDESFMANLRREAAGLKFNIQFDAEGKIVPTPGSCADIFRALLDHRLDSRLSRKLYDVENVADVG